STLQSSGTFYFALTSREGPGLSYALSLAFVAETSNARRFKIALLSDSLTVKLSNRGLSWSWSR
ncbi:MAG: hypothetical protein WB799_07495, partial [Candidatus Sulfotelmatobacter sp.]